MARSILFALGALAFYSGWTFFAKISTNTLPAEQSVVYTYIAGLVPVLVYIGLRGDSLVLAPRGIGIALLSGLFIGLGTLTYYIALESGSAAVATSISGLYLLSTTALAVTFLNESLSTLNLLGVVCAVCAVVLLTQ